MNVVIVGGGISGLATAYALKERAKEADMEIELLVLEKENRFGGTILTEKIDGFVIEGGPDCFITEKPWALELSKKLGIEDRLLNTNEENTGTFIFSDGKLHRLPEGTILMVPTNFVSFITTGLMSWPGKIRMALDLIIPKRCESDDESLASFVRRRLGQEVLDKIAEPLVAGIHAGNPEEMSLKSTFPRFIEMELEHRSLILAILARKKKMQAEMKNAPIPKRTYFVSYVGGMVDLIDALAAAIGSKNLLLGKKVLNVEEKTRVHGQKPVYEVNIEGERPIQTDAVIFTTPAFVTAEIIEDLDKSVAEKLRAIPYASSATVSLAYEKSSIPHPLKGFGFVVPRIESRKIMATTWSSSKWAYRVPKGYVLLRAFVGGAQHQKYAMLDDEHMIRMVRTELKDIMGIEAEPVLTKVYRWEMGMPQYTIGHLDRLAVLEQQLAEHSGLFITGAGYRGVGIPDCIHNGTLTAERVFEFLKKKF
ncbi:MAG: protoporphyrinogen oxidase [Euryarchaeota archaeon]|nr:protoporphyrinogen oxidase [Euryarchaeota archaeon]